jgi:hypothetical protein
MVTIGSDIFSHNPRSFTAYFEPEGDFEVAKRRIPRETTLQNHLPLTCAVAENMLRALSSPWAWAVQIKNGNWPQQVVGRLKRGYMGQEAWCLPMRPLDLTRAFYGLTLAVGNTDAHQKAWETVDWEPQAEYWRARSGRDCRPECVTMLRLDTDQDEPWRWKQLGPVRDQLLAEMTAANALNLEYHVFATGNRGTQAVLPLPVPVTLRMASWLMWAFRTLLAPLAHPTAKLCVDNLSSVMRLPGGQHAKSRSLGLWINPYEMEFYPIDVQAELMQKAFLPRWQHPENWIYQVDSCGDELWHPFRDAAREIDLFLESEGIPHAQTLSEAQCELAAEALFWNPLVRRFEEGRCRWLHLETVTSKSKPESDTVFGYDADQECGIEKLPNCNCSKNEVIEDSEDLSSWAQRIWNMGYEEGNFWDWINGKGHYGIAAAYVLFGQGAEQALCEQAERMPFTSPGEIGRRKAKVQRLWRAFRFVPPVHVRRWRVVTGEASEEEQGWLSAIMERFPCQSAKQKQMRPSLAAVTAILLRALISSETGTIELSYEDISQNVATRFPDFTLNRMTVKRRVTMLVEEDKACVVPLLRRLPASFGQIMAFKYAPGSAWLELRCANS